MNVNQPPQGQPGGEPPYGQPPPAYQAPIYQAPAYPTAGGAQGRARAGGSGRPGSVTAVVVLTILGASLVIALGVLMVIGLASKSILRGYATRPLGNTSLTESAFLFGGMGVGFLLFGIALIVLAVHAGRGRNGVRIALTVIGGLFVVLFSFSVPGDPGVLVPVLYVALVVLLLWVGGANAWFRAQKAARKAANAAPPTPPPAGPPAPPFG